MLTCRSLVVVSSVPGWLAWLAGLAGLVGRSIDSSGQIKMLTDPSFRQFLVVQ